MLVNDEALFPFLIKSFQFGDGYVFGSGVFGILGDSLVGVNEHYIGAFRLLEGAFHPFVVSIPPRGTGQWDIIEQGVARQYPTFLNRGW